MAGGHPRKFKTPKALAKKIKKYEKLLKKTGEPFLLIGFADFCGVHRSILDDYAKFPEYTGIIKKIKQKAEKSLVAGAMVGKYNASFSMFLAKNNHGYKDRSETVLEGGEKPIETVWKVEVVDSDE